MLKLHALESGTAGSVPRIRAGAASGVLEQIAQSGGDPERVLAATRIAQGDLDGDDKPVALADYCAMFEAASHETADNGFGLRFGARQSVRLLGDLGRLALAAPTLGGALQSLARHFPALQEHSSLSLRQSGEWASLSYQITDGRIVARRQDAELTLAALTVLIRDVAGAAWAPEEIHLEHVRPADTAAHAELFRAPLLFPRAGERDRFSGADVAGPDAKC